MAGSFVPEEPAATPEKPVVQFGCFIRSGLRTSAELQGRPARGSSWSCRFARAGETLGGPAIQVKLTLKNVSTRLSS